MKTGLLLVGLRINFNQRAPLAGFITPCVAVRDRSGLIHNYRITHRHIVTSSSRDTGNVRIAWGGVIS